MPLTKFNSLLLLISISLLGALSCVAFSEEEGEAKPAAKEEKGAANLEWTDRVTRLNTAESKMKALKKDIHEKLEELRGNPDRAKQVSIAKELEGMQKGLKTSVEEYNQVREELKYKFPSQGEVTQRRYLEMKEQSLDEIEQEMGLGPQLSRLKKKVDAKYQSFADPDDIKPQPIREPAQEDKKHPAEVEKPKRLRLER